MGEKLIVNHRVSTVLTGFWQLLTDKKIDITKTVKLLINKNAGLWSRLKSGDTDGSLSTTTTAQQLWDSLSDQIDNTSSVIDSSRLQLVVHQVLDNCPREVSRYKQGEQKLINFFLGQTLKRLSERVDGGLVKKELRKQLEDE